MKKLIMILGDQLSLSISSLTHSNPNQDEILMMEVLEEVEYAPHHAKKLAFIFSSMRHFKKELEEKGFSVHYISILDQVTSFKQGLLSFLKKHDFDQVLVTEPSEWRVFKMFHKLQKSIPLVILEDGRFFVSKAEFKSWASGKKKLVMEHFYRLQRKKTLLLMDDQKNPEEGVWNFDKENRKKLPKDVSIPPIIQHKKDAITQKVIEDIQTLFPNQFGSLDNFFFATTRKQALLSLDHFIKEKLISFGPYQDAMVKEEPFLFHSFISQYLNIGLLTPREVCKKVEKAYYDKKAPLNSVEGFIRQVLGWREYIRGIYWTFMPDYKEKNQMEAHRALPEFYWSGNTQMQCMHHAIETTKQHAQSHHIQRLMVTGNFALLAGVDPKEVCLWYLAVYADAYEWVELPNTLGMALFGDGGIVATKPYAASGAYINRMSNYCKSCVYEHKQKIGENACPFNFLYWNFLQKNKEEFSKNPRMALIVKQLEKMDENVVKEIERKASSFLDNLA